MGITKLKNSKNRIISGMNSLDVKELSASRTPNSGSTIIRDTQWIGAVCKEAVKATKRKKPIYSGLFICPNPENKANETDPENFGLLPEELEAAIEESIKNGAKGICLFTAGRMTPEHWTVFDNVIHHK